MPAPSPRRCRQPCRRFALAAGLSLLLGCAGYGPLASDRPGVAPSPGVPWVPPAAQVEPVPVLPEVRQLPPDLAAAAADLTLAQIVDVALRTSTQTRAAWAAARAAAAAYGSRRGDWLPRLDASANATRQQRAPQAGLPARAQTSYAGAVNLSYLLFNFGGREADIEASRQALLAADWSHNGAIQTVILRVEQAYYRYFAVRALLAAEQSTLAEVEANLDAAEARHRAGLATIADVLQARTARSQVQLSIAGLEGQIAVTRGALATAMGLPANLPFDAQLPAWEPPRQQVRAGVDSLLAQGVARRPDLASARAQAIAAAAHVRAVRAEGLPSLSAQGSLGRTWLVDPDRNGNTYLAGLQLRFPLFTGLSHTYDVRRADAEADQARQRLGSLQQTVVLQVWTSYYDLGTAEQRLTASDDLLRSAAESRDVAVGRYHAGTGSILDLQSAQAALEQARAQQVQARADWYLSLAQLAHDTGTLAATGGGDDASKGSSP